MATLFQFSERLSVLNNQAYLLELFFKAVRNSEKVLIGLQKGQFADGYDAKGEELGRYSRSTEIEALFGDVRPRKPKTEGELYNLEWTGDFVDGVFVKYTDADVSLFSTGSSTPFLNARHKDLFGLDDENLSNYIKNQILPAFLLEVRKTLQLD